MQDLFTCFLIGSRNFFCCSFLAAVLLQVFLLNWDVWKGVVIYSLCSVFYKSRVWWIYVVVAGLFAKSDICFATSLLTSFPYWAFGFRSGWIDSCCLVWTLNILSAVKWGTTKFSNRLMLALCRRKNEVHRAPEQVPLKGAWPIRCC